AEQTVQTPIVSGFCSDPAWQPSPSEECTFNAILRQLLTFVKVRSGTPGTEAVWATRRATVYGPDRKGKSPTVNTPEALPAILGGGARAFRSIPIDPGQSCSALSPDFFFWPASA